MKRFIAVLVACLLALSGCGTGREEVPNMEREEIPAQVTPEPAPSEPERVPEPEVEPVDLSQLTMPPALTVICGEEELPASNCGCMWVTEHGILCADAPTPLQLKQNLIKLETVEQIAVLEFEVPPDECRVQAWDENCTEACDGIGQYVVAREGSEIELLPGGYIYDVSAKWGDGETAGGTGRYAFYIEKLYPGNE